MSGMDRPRCWPIAPGAQPDASARRGDPDGAPLDAAGADLWRRADVLDEAASQALFAARITADALPRLLALDPAEGHRTLRELSALIRAAGDAMRASRDTRPRPPRLRD